VDSYIRVNVSVLLHVDHTWLARLRPKGIWVMSRCDKVIWVNQIATLYSDSNVDEGKKGNEIYGPWLRTFTGPQKSYSLTKKSYKIDAGTEVTCLG